MTFDSLAGNAELKSALRRALGTRFPQTILLTGVPGSGKLTAAKVVASALLCEQNGSVPCGQCIACRKVEKGIHPDLTLIDPADGEIKVETARAIRADSAVRPSESARRVFLIRHAHKMNPSAQNALLKVLEEPPAYAFFVLMSENADAILPTILSRCTQFALSPVSLRETEGVLRARFPEKTEQERAQAARSAQGIIGEAVRLLNEETDDLTPVLAPIVRALAEGTEFGIVRACNACADMTRPQFAAVLDGLCLALRDAVMASEELSEPLNSALRAETASLGVRVPQHKLLELYDWVGEIAGRIPLNTGIPLLSACLAAHAYEIIRNGTSTACGRASARTGTAF
ncbi:MAG: ATP-binding protein [Butyricicoccaceae bacterium]